LDFWELGAFLGWRLLEAGLFGGQFPVLPRRGNPRVRPEGQARGFVSRMKRWSEEKVALVGFPFRPAVPPEAHFLGIVGAEFIAKKLPVWCTPRLQLPIYDRQMFSAKSAAGRSVLFTEDFPHLSFLTPGR
jgi:hypothetical protein